MRFITTTSRKVRYLIVAVVLSCIGIAAVSLQRASVFYTKASSQINSPSIKEGVRNELKFASRGDSAHDITAAVNSVDSFIYKRSGLKMSDETKGKLVTAEANTLNGSTQRISPDSLTTLLTNSANTKLANISEQEIERFANDFAAPQDPMALRAKLQWAFSTKTSFVNELQGEWAFSTKTSFAKELRRVREVSRQMSNSTAIGIRNSVAQEVNGRITILNDALPEQFQNAKSEGLTPLQSVLLVYSIATGDTLEMSQKELNAQIVQQRRDAGQMRDLEPGRRRQTSRAYGVGGAIKSSPLILFFDKSTVSQIIEGGVNR